MAKNLEEAKCELKTQLGTSEEQCQHNELHPIHGSGQGSSDSPMTWSFASGVLFKVHEKKAHGAHFVSFDLSKETKATMIGFVDDAASCMAATTHYMDIDELMSRMQHNAQL